MALAEKAKKPLQIVEDSPGLANGSQLKPAELDRRRPLAPFPRDSLAPEGEAKHGQEFRGNDRTHAYSRIRRQEAFGTRAIARPRLARQADPQAGIRQS